MKPLLPLALLSLVAAAQAQTTVTHDGFLTQRAIPSDLAGHADGAPLGFYLDNALNADTGAVGNHYMNAGAHSATDVQFDGRAQDALTASSYSVSLSADMAGTSTFLDGNAYVQLTSMAVDTWTFSVPSPTSVAFDWSKSAGSLSLYDSTNADLLMPDLSSAGSKSLLLAAGTYVLQGAAQQDWLASSRFGYLGGDVTGGKSLDYHAVFGAPVPEPAGMAVVGVGAVSLLRRWRVTK